MAGHCVTEFVSVLQRDLHHMLPIFLYLITHAVDIRTDPENQLR